MPFLQLFFSTFGEKASLQLQCDIHMEPLRTEIAIALIIGMITMSKAMTDTEHFTGEVDFDFQNLRVLINILRNFLIINSVLISRI